MKKKICFVVSAYATATSFLKDHIKALSEIADVYIVANLDGKSVDPFYGVKEIKDIHINRGITVIADLKAVATLASYLKDMKFDVVHSVTPKAGLVTALAAKMAGIKHRVHIFTGQVWATRKGPMRALLKTMDKIIATMDNHILVDGESQRQFLISEGVVSARKSRVLGAGSICGANSERFKPIDGEKEHQRKIMNIPSDKIVYAFMGRLNEEKGIYELLESFNDITPKCPKAFLALFGWDEENCLSHLDDYPNIRSNENFQFYGPTKKPELSLQVADVFCLPSYREGFGLSVVEASSLKLPVICSDAYGLADTLADNETGLRCKVADVYSLEKAMIELYDNPSLRKKLGKQGRERVLKLFKGETIVAEWVKYYKEILHCV